MISFPNAKINIGLNVVSRRQDGFHNLETVFYPIQLADILEVIEGGPFEFSSSGIEIIIEPEKNLVVKAFRLLQNEFNLPEVKIHLHKVIPFGAGLGGGSSDAAFMLKIINNLFGIGLSQTQLETRAAQLGADCPFFIANSTSFATGTGNQLQPVLLNLSNYKLVLVKPIVGVDTAWAYRNIVPHQPCISLIKLIEKPVEEWKSCIANDFEIPVFKTYPEIEAIKHKLYNLGAVYASMSGSGSSVFGVFSHLPASFSQNFPKNSFIYF